MNKLHISVSGIANTQMKTSLKNSLEKIEGVQMINIDMARQTVEGGFNSPANENDVKKCIEHTGFKVF
jgi:copper chaperone CopZ